MTEYVPFKKRKCNTLQYDDNFAVPVTNIIQRKKCSNLEDGLVIKYNKLMLNFDKILNFKHFRKYRVFFDIDSKRHFVYHEYRTNMLEILNKYDFRPYAYEECYCQRPVSTSCLGFYICFKPNFMERKKYVNHKTYKSEHMKHLYELHSTLNEDNLFFDNKITESFLLRIKRFEEYKSLVELDTKTLKLFHKNMYTYPPCLLKCPRCKNMISTTYSKWKAIKFSNIQNKFNLCDYVLKLHDEFFVPDYYIDENYDDKTIKDTDDNLRIIVYKNLPTNLVFIDDNVVNVINSNSAILIFDIETFINVKFFCNFNFYFARKTLIYTNNNYITINNN